jgi:hypothetical protein
MASVILLDKSLVEHAVTTTRDFNYRVYGLGWTPKTGTIEENYNILLAGSGPVSPPSGSYVTTSAFTAAMEAKANLVHTHLAASLGSSGTRSATTVLHGDDVWREVASPVVDATDTLKGIVELATTAEATTGTDTTRAVTPAGLKAVGDTKAASSHTHSVTNLTATGTRDATTVLHGDNTWKVPSGAGVGAATETTSGIVELATTAEATTGTDTTRAVTPAGVKAVADTKAATSHTHTAANISDSTTTGRSVLTAASTTAARTAIGAGTSDLALGSTGTTAAAGNHTHTAAAVGAVEAVTAGLKMREMTQAAYDALGTKDNLTLYVIRG